MPFPRSNETNRIRIDETAGEAEYAQKAAIIGLACRFSGDAVDGNTFWNLLCKSQSSHSNTHRFNPRGFCDDGVKKQNKSATGGGHFLKQDTGVFDAGFFGITHEEALAMDPQQRLMLEVAYEAFENAGIPIHEAAGSNTSCIIANFTSDYREMIFRDADAGPRYTVTGTGASMLANRISWFFDLRGPSITVNTACSSSLVALHLARRSLESGEADLAIVGGSNLILGPEMFTFFSNLNFLSRDGLCKSFDAVGDGYGRGEGVAAIILKRVGDAIQDRNRIRAIVRGTGVNQDGKTKAITLPSLQAQIDLIRSTYAEARLGFEDTHYFEAHGTGTRRGDPVELEAISQTLLSGRPSSSKLIVGSVKSNIGHTEATAGLAGIIKGIYILEQGLIPPSIHYNTPLPEFDIIKSGITIPTESMAWPTNGVRRLSINSFGFGGTNSHAVLDDAFSYLRSNGLLAGHNQTKTCAIMNGSGTRFEITTLHSKPKVECQKLLFAFSAADQDSLKVYMDAFARHVDTRIFSDSHDEALYLLDLGHTLAERRSQFKWKATVIADSAKNLVSQIRNRKAEYNTSSMDVEKRVGFVFSGQGSQWPRMGVELLLNNVFRENIEAADRYICAELGCSWSLKRELLKPITKSRLDDPTYCQVISTTLQIALVDMLGSWGVKPCAVVGHSSGEIAAAYSVGALSKEDAWKIAYYRGVLSAQVNSISGSVGAMLAVGLSRDSTETWIKKLPTSCVSIACINSSTSTTVSGEFSAVIELQRLLREEQVSVSRLKVNTAYHSHHMNDVATLYLEAIDNFKPLSSAPAHQQMYSSVTGCLIDPAELGPAYWATNMKSPVQFANAIRELLLPSVGGQETLKHRVDILLEIGPHSVLQNPIKETMTELGIAQVEYTCLLYRGKDAIETTLQAAARLYQRGIPIKLNRIYDIDTTHPPQLVTDLPSYSWNHSYTYWAESRMSREYRSRQHAGRDLIGAPQPAYGENERCWRGFLRTSEQRWLVDHQILNSIIYPAAGYITMAIEAVRESSDKNRIVNNFKLRDVQLIAAAVIKEESPLECVIRLRPHLSGTRDTTTCWQEFVISTCGNGRDLRENCTGLVIVEYEATEGSAAAEERNLEDISVREQFEESTRACHKKQNSSTLYEELASAGLTYGPAFQQILRIAKSNGHSRCDVGVYTPDQSCRERPYVIHPATLDSMIQTIFPALVGENGRMQSAMVPKLFEEITISAQTSSEPNTYFNGYATSKYHGFREMTANFVMLDQATLKAVVTVKGLRCITVSGIPMRQDEQSDVDARNICSRLIYTPAMDLLSPDQQLQIVLSSAPSYEGPYSDKIHSFDQLALLYMRRATQIVTQHTTRDAQAQSLLSWIQRCISMSSSNKKMPKGLANKQHDEDIHIPTALEKKVSGYGKEGEHLCKVGGALLSAFSHNQCDLRPLVEIGGQGWRASNANYDREVLHKLSKYIEALACTRPNFSVLEIGGGTEDTASVILSFLQPDLIGGGALSYTFTDKDREVVEKAAKNTLSKFKAMLTFETLDLDKSLESQGFDDRKFDVIIFSTTCNISSSLGNNEENAQKLLKQNGKLCLLRISMKSLRPATLLRHLPEMLGNQSIISNPETLTDPVPRVSGTSLLESANDHDSIKMLQRHGLDAEFVACDFQDWRHGFDLVVASKRPGQVQQSFEGDIIILEGDTGSSGNLSEELISKLPANCAFERVSKKQFLSSRVELSGKTCISTLELEEPFFSRERPEDFATFKSLIQQCSSLLWISPSDHPMGSIFPGLARSLRNENAGVRIRTLQVPSKNPQGLADLSEIIALLISSPSPDNEFVLDEEILKVSRVMVDRGMNSSLAHMISGHGIRYECNSLGAANGPQKLSIRTPGMLDTLYYETDEMAHEPLGDDEVEIEVKATGLNFRDVMVLMGNIPDRLLGFEASGIISRVGQRVQVLCVGDRVCTLGHGCHRSVFRNTENLVHKIPPGMSFEEAATLPLVHCTAYNALVRVARAQKGQSVLIHAAAGGVGQAAIQLATHLGLEIFATVGSPAKRELIQNEYGIKENQIFNSRDTSFAKGIMRVTSGRGVDIILNSLAGEMLRQSWHCLAPFGTFVEIGIKDILANTRLDMNPFEKDATFAFFNLSHVLDKTPNIMAGIMHDTFQLLQANITKSVTPLTIKTISEVEDAFRLLQTGKHTGKIALVWDPKQEVRIATIVTRAKLPSNATYVLVGGFGGIGRSVATMLANRGARNLCFISRSGSQSDKSRSLIRKLEEQDVNVRSFNCNIADAQSLKLVFETCSQTMPPIRGVVQGAMVLRDVSFERMTHRDWQDSLRPKVDGSWNLHELMPRELDFFVMLSSFTGVFGSRTQGNYAAACSFQDSLAYYRRSMGLKAVTLDLGIMRDIGVLAENGAIGDFKQWEESFGIREFELVGLLDHVIANEVVANKSSAAQILTGFATADAAKQACIARPYYLDDARFSLLTSTTLGTASSEAASARKPISLSKQLTHVGSLAEARVIVTDAITCKVAELLQVCPTDIDVEDPLYSIGVDSLVAIELKNWIMKETNLDVSLFDILAENPLRELAWLVASQSPLL